jgi:hypothetical protein
MDIKAHLNNSRSPVRKEIEFAYNHYPTEWVERSVDRGQITCKKANRGFYSDWQKIIAIDGNSENSQRATAFHELGHRFEKTIPGLMEAEKAFYARRTTGEELKWLGRPYGKSEKTRRDDFVHPYMGKEYGGQWYELVSMGFQYAYTEPEMLAKDKDMQSWIYGLLALI